VSALGRLRSDPRVSRVWNAALYSALPVLGFPLTQGTRAPGPARVLVDVSDRPRAGAFTALSALLGALVERGLNVRLVTPESPPAAGYEVAAAVGSQDLIGHYRWADVVLTQRARTKSASRLAAFTHRPLIYLLHDPTTDIWDELRRPPDLMIPVADHILAAHGSPPHGMVVRPPIDAAPYRTEPGSAVTLVNLSEWKGAEVFYALAERMPQTLFLGVRGWGEQIVPEVLPANVEIVGPTDDMRSVYGRTRVLLTPSWSEGFPRTPLEAAASGIPVIAHPCAGLREALGDAGIYADRADTDAWRMALESLADPTTYTAARRRSAARFAQVAQQSAREVAALAEWIHAASASTRPAAVGVTEDGA
jgi:glycosyltransferase involved in cell wall biosynthesis